RPRRCHHAQPPATLSNLRGQPAALQLLHMRSTNTIMRTILIVACALVAGLAAYPATVGAQAAKDEYDLGKLPQANGDNETSGVPGAASDSDDGEGGASPVLLIVLG